MNINLNLNSKNNNLTSTPTPTHTHTYTNTPINTNPNNSHNTHINNINLSPRLELNSNIQSGMCTLSIKQTISTTNTSKIHDNNYDNMYNGRPRKLLYF